ncbi:tyrosine--tRNA ligase [Rickettsiales endosymbiont of Stachyamoeba lipophora]|uniref:tyrosine--tRNA ligase n=1 Tax=Rickettsiales endosymbiont of Stachyamoeba lipophora TaxID=2486578 RepID=UPI000F64EB35|nr:tyrosine--tRNA ligase [Rickettsiales endosymbiont of Stachyamoeba lipophora]AZL15130.1 tyrosine--tRNA ligase [Rickettsiales endosymbiont of Stachyamoeba lipophora]
MQNHHFKSGFLKEFCARGYFYQATDLAQLDELFASKSAIVYLGFDCTAKSLHVGSLMQIMILRLLQKHGHKPIVLMGGGTTLIGDPSFKDQERKMLATTAIQENMDGMKQIFAKYIKFGSDTNDAKMVNNADWLCKLNYLEFLRDYGRHFSVNRMLTMDSVKLRLEREQSLSFLEFNYMLLQAYDFAYLNEHSQCQVQIGGSDQWSNIINGVDLSRKLALKECFGLTTPLITTAGGAKMGKTENGAVWLNGDMLAPYDYWQFWRNVDDRDVIKFLKMFTDLEVEKIDQLALETQNINELKKMLADEATKLCHGEEETQKARATAENTFGSAKSGEGLPEFELSKEELTDGRLLFDIIRAAGLTPNGAEAKRMIKSNAVKINDQPITEELYKVSVSDFVEEQKTKLSVGKKKHILLVLK